MSSLLHVGKGRPSMLPIASDTSDVVVPAVTFLHRLARHPTRIESHGVRPVPVCRKIHINRAVFACGFFVPHRQKPVGSDDKATESADFPDCLFCDI